jgi:uncharacterized protein YjdB
MFDRFRLGTVLLIGLAMPFIGCGSSSEVDSIQVTPSAVSFGGTGLTAQLTAIGTVGHGGHPATYVNVTDQVTWSSDAPEVASVSSSGLVTATGPGTIQITASINGYPGDVTGSSAITVTLPTSSERGVGPGTALSVIGGAQTAATPGEATQFRVVRTSGATGVQEDLTNSVTWSSTNAGVATVSKSGLVMGLSQGMTTITATVTNPDKTVVAAAAPFTVGGTGASWGTAP